MTEPAVARSVDPEVPADISTEVTSVLRMVLDHRARLINMGHGRTLAARARAWAFLRVWEARGGEVGTVVDWPDTAASWLRQACRFASGSPDVWVVADEPVGWAFFGRRLATVPGWRAARTVAFSGLADPDLPRAAGWEATEGLHGTLPDGTTWSFDDGSLTIPGRAPRRRTGGCADAGRP